MIELSYKNYKIKIFNDEGYSKDSTDNLNKYDFEYGEDGVNYYSTHGIEILNEETNKSKSIALFASGGVTEIHKDSVILDKGNLVVCVGNYLFSINIVSSKLNWKTKVDFATSLGAYLKDDYYIVHGEVEISKITRDGNIKWQFSGKDIFVNLNGGEDFKIEKDFISVKDFENNMYKIDLESGKGNII